MTAKPLKPFLKWAGGKHRLVPRIAAILPKGKRLIEPFCGSAAVFLGTDYNHAILADVNNDLISLYRLLQRNGEDFIADCQSLFTPETNTETAYLTLRAEFNTCTDPRRRAALFIYLNRHGFNGLCRYNSKGGFNVPFGRYTTPKLPMDAMRSFAKRSQNVEFMTADFRMTMDRAQAGDVVYCDPPYVPISNTAHFTTYAAGGFTLEDQQELADRAEFLRRTGIPVLISNHNTAFTRAVYSAAELTTFSVQRFISSDTQNRGSAEELLAFFV